MNDSSAREEVMKRIDALPPESLRIVLAFIERFSEAGTSLPVGTPGKSLLKYGGFLSKEDARLMQQEIEDAFESVDVRER